MRRILFAAIALAGLWIAPAEASNTCAGYLTVAVLDPTYFTDGYYDETICGGGSVAVPDVGLMTRTNASTAITTATLVVAGDR